MPTYNFLAHGRDKTGNRGLSPQALQQTGPLIPVTLNVQPVLEEELRRTGKTAPATQQGMGLIDTGATRTAVDEKVLQTLGIKPISRIYVGTAAGKNEHGIFPIQLVFQSPPASVVVQCVGVDLAGQKMVAEEGQMDIIALIGRDILSRTIFVYNGTLGIISLSL